MPPLAARSSLQAHAPAHAPAARRRSLGAVAGALLVALLAQPAGATVTVSGPADNSAYFPLVMPTGAFDERGLSGFEFLIGGVETGFFAGDQYIVQGEDTNPAQTIFADLGTAADLSGETFDFSIQHNLASGRNFTFSISNALQTSVLCWGLGCAPGSISAETINGFAPILDYNGLQVQIRAQDVLGATTQVQIQGLTGVMLNLQEPLFDETVTLSTPGTILPFDLGRRGQWFMADDNDLTANEWELFGTVTLTRPDDATTDRTKVRLAVDLVRNESLPFVPEPSTGLLVGLGLAGLAARRERRP